MSMTPSQTIESAKSKFGQALEYFQGELKKLRTGRASTGMVDGLLIEAYGTPMPLNQVATVSTPEAQLLQVTPFDPANLQAIVNAIRDNQSLGLNPSDDGRVVRVPIPALTEERRRDITKQVNGKQEECMVRLRAIRHDAIDTIDQFKKDKEIGEDDAKRLVQQLEDAMTKTKQEVDATAKTKEQEIMTV